jgi:hypothetical protein
MKLMYRLWIGVAALNSLVMAEVQRPAIPYFPDAGGYRTLVCDFHTHTVFSDGQVWPTVRVEEAWREGLDAVALTDHIEHQPHKADIPTQHERPYELSLPKARDMNVLLIKGTEITKKTPPGHYNAVFVTAIDPIEDPNVLVSVQRAAEQGAFVFWDHHAWQGVKLGQWEPLQTTMVENKWLHGLEVANGDTYYPLAHQWCLDRNLTMLGNSDIHSPSLDAVYTPQTHRTLTLVLARQRTVESIHEALTAGRTVVWYGNQLIGRQEHVLPLYEASVTVGPAYHTQSGIAFFEIANRSFLDLEYERVGKSGPAKISVPARSTALVRAPLAEDGGSQNLPYLVKNILIAPDTGLPVTIPVVAPSTAAK